MKRNPDAKGSRKGGGANSRPSAATRKLKWPARARESFWRGVRRVLGADVIWSGAFIAIENLIDDARRENAFGLLMSLNMLIELGDAFDYTGADFRGWCSEVGFKRFEIIPLAGPTSAAVAYK